MNSFFSNTYFKIFGPITALAVIVFLLWFGNVLYNAVVTDAYNSGVQAAQQQVNTKTKIITQQIIVHDKQLNTDANNQIVIVDHNIVTQQANIDAYVITNSPADEKWANDTNNQIFSDIEASTK